MPRELTQAVVTEWVSLVKGTFDIKDMWYEFGVQSVENRKKLRVYLYRLEEKNILVYLGGNKFRKVDTKLEKVDWQSADSGNIMDVKWPFHLEKYALIYPKNVAIIAGSKQEGKTTFLYNFIKLNKQNYTIDLYNTETGPEQMKDRFIDLGISPDCTDFNVYQRYENFADVINPNHISVIDYLDMNSEYYLAGTEIDAIFRKTQSLAVIGMQIPPPTVTYIKGVKKVIDRDYAYGGGTTAKRAFIYISMSSRRLKIKHAKKPAQRNINPANMTWSYEFDECGQFTNIQPYYGETNQGNF